MYGQGSAVAMSIAAQDKTASRKGEVAGEMDRLRMVGDQLGETVQMLVKRLDPVRRQIGGTKPDSAESDPEPALCTVASAIRADRQSLERVLAMVSLALHELEI